MTELPEAGLSKGNSTSSNYNDVDKNNLSSTAVPEETAVLPGMLKPSPSQRIGSTARDLDEPEDSWLQQHKNTLLFAGGVFVALVVVISCVAAFSGGNSSTTSAASNSATVTGAPPTANNGTAPTTPTITNRTVPTSAPTALRATKAPTKPPTMTATKTPTPPPATTAPTTTVAAPTTARPTRTPTISPAPTKAPIKQPTAAPTITMTPTLPPITSPPVAEPRGDPCSMTGDNPCANATQVCVLGYCMDNRLRDNSTCKLSSDCDENRCGLAEYDKNAPNICCPQGDAIEVPVAWTMTHQWICSHAAAGAKCVQDETCESKACVEGVCAQARLKAGAICDSDFDCVHNKCGRAAYNATADMVCCPNGDSILLQVKWNLELESFCSHLPEGAQCQEDVSCESGACVNGQCASSFIQDGDECDHDANCEHFYCGFSEFDMNATKVCCQNGDALPASLGGLVDTDWQYSHAWICGHLQLGDKCFDNALCESGVCSLGLCVETAVSDSQPCDLDNSCQSGRCGRSAESQDAPKICCPGGKAEVKTPSWSQTWEWFCSTSSTASAPTIGSAADGAACANNLDCASRVCGKNEFSEAASDMCCDTAGQFYKKSVPWSYNMYIFCGNRATGTACGDDRMCATGHCVKSVCTENLVADADTCNKDSDCSSRICASGAFDPNATQICCPGGEYYRLDVDWSYELESFCGDLPVGTACGDDRMCKTGLCVSGKCSNTGLADGETCLEDFDCQNLACAKNGYGNDTALECCANGSKAMLGFPGEYVPIWYCGDVKRPIRSQCTKDEQCESKTCVENMCT